MIQTHIDPQMTQIYVSKIYPRFIRVHPWLNKNPKSDQRVFSSRPFACLRGENKPKRPARTRAGRLPSGRGPLRWTVCHSPCPPRTLELHRLPAMSLRFSRLSRPVLPLLGLTLPLAASAFEITVIDTPPSVDGVPVFEQELVVEGGPVQVEIAPVYGDKDWAFTTRWDDNNLNSLNMHAAMADIGLKGSFYLNGSGGQTGAAYAQELSTDGAASGGTPAITITCPRSRPTRSFTKSSSTASSARPTRTARSIPSPFPSGVSRTPPSLPRWRGSPRPGCAAATTTTFTAPSSRTTPA